MTETWSFVPGYHGAYSVSDFGRVRSNTSSVACGRGGLRNKAERILAPFRNPSNGFLSVCLSGSSGRKQWQIHRLVASAFVTNTNSLSYVRHINGVKLDNRSVNLEWSCSKESRPVNVSKTVDGAPELLGEQEAYQVFQIFRKSKDRVEDIMKMGYFLEYPPKGYGYALLQLADGFLWSGVTSFDRVAMT